MTAQRWACADIDLFALEHNVRTLCARIQPQQLWAVVKANGYGHGAVPVATTAIEAGAEGLCVALVDEGIELRDAQIDVPILVMSEQPSSQHLAMIDHRLTATLYNAETIAQFAHVARDRGVVTNVHLKVDTGMHRVGASLENAVQLAKQIEAEPSLRLEGVYTHFATADLDGHSATSLQYERFFHVVDQLHQAGITPAMIHTSNSAAAIRRLDTRSTMARIGIAMYGIATNAETDSFGSPSDVSLEPVLSLRARVSHVRWVEAGEGVSYGLKRPLAARTRIATLPIGYADGVPRQLWSEGEVLIGGRRRRIAGVVTMDQTMIDCGQDEVAIGTEAVLIGRQGAEYISANEIARHVDSIGYDIVCGISARVPRNYVRSAH